MKKFLLISLLLVSTLGLVSCADSDAPLTEAQQAEQYNMSITEYKETKTAAAKMNMTIEDHMKMMQSNETTPGMNMDMGDDSSMIEDDSETKMVMPEGSHKMADGTIMKADGTIMEAGEVMNGSHTMIDGTEMNNNEAMSEKSEHTMTDGTEMTDEQMHIQLQHDGDTSVPEHPSAEH